MPLAASSGQDLKELASEKPDVTLLFRLRHKTISHSAYRPQMLRPLPRTGGQFVSQAALDGSFYGFCSFCSSGKAAGFCGERKKESRAVVYLPFRPDRSTVLFDNALNCGKSHPSAFKIFRAVEALEDPEQLADVPLVEACTIIPNEDNRYAVIVDLANFDDSDFALAGIFHGIRKQVREFLFH